MRRAAVLMLAVGRRLQPVQDPQGKQRGDSLPIGRALEDLDAVVGRAYRLVARAAALAVLPQVVELHAPPKRAERVHDLTRHAARVEDALATLPELAQNGRERRVAEEFSDTRGAHPVRHVIGGDEQPGRFRPAGARPVLLHQVRLCLRPLERNDRRDGKAVFSKPHRRLEDGREWKRTPCLDRITPRSCRSWHGRCVRVQ
mmetsp:Transcript_3219/g.6745  ORF Transcript_3219/g.6745 Transcript_3219/m.6745 type:complete len:201 (-) Transcript_3219:250-852(-)